MKKIIPFTIAGILLLVLTACGASSSSSQTNSSSGSSVTNTDVPSSSSPAPSIVLSGSSTPAPTGVAPLIGPSGLQLAAGMLKLEGTSNAVTAQEATQLLPLWQSLQQIQSSVTPQAGTQGTPAAQPNPTMMASMMAMRQQMATQIVLIQNAMPPAQIQAITAMNLNMQDIFTTFQQAGITLGRPGQGGGFNGGTFTPPQGTPAAAGTPGAYGGYGGFGGGTPRAGGGMRMGMGNFIPPSVVNGIVQFLQTKAGS